MSLPRQIVPGRVYMVTRRCSERRFFMRPDHATTEAFLYCLILAAQRCNVGLIAFLANSNHWHGIVIDRDGRLPEFIHFFHVLFAKHQNCLRGRWENFWASEQTSIVELIEPGDIVDKCAYALANPVKDQLVEKAHHWPGASALVALRHPRAICATRPKRFFRADGNLPHVVSLELSVPRGFVGRAEFRRRVDEQIAVVAIAATEKRRGSRRHVLGSKAVLAQPWSQRPDSQEPRRQLSPRVACRSKWARIEALQRNKQWLDAYAACRARYVAGDRRVVFPAGTYWLARQSAVKVAPWAERPG